MRLMVMFDLPVETSEERRAYRKFRKALINEGFLMIQFSVYVRVCVTRQSADFMEKRIAAISPDSGIIQSLMLTEKQYNDMHFILGEPKKDVRNSSERTIIL
ncbi:MAG: CRISPR-associated endonuclease Cas2 [Lentilactobacillus diolivorans]|nr:CRISPR-associated endonuclease Cas2 [Lentilactobacillus diolivorans]MCH4163997.1 CRISPR-associated endonuclease Cas2 [Lentilactobacillus diolivorans]MDH5104791.1 CRISPR-associated endonuclease Cas2 [Lentilactobacillus diolivorans]RRG02947.1 MAG: CRISPR-associated endonuclease Cas2 [Lactobacillus sp.]GEP23986.1 CRISPR-associated endoribonuclease Cas2 [Lentilactobacillus diolivorans]